MKTSDFNWGDKVIDSRDIIARYEELNEELDGLQSLVDDSEEELANFLKENGLPEDFPNGEYSEDILEELGQLEETLEEAEGNLNDFIISDDKGELDMLKDIVEQGESSPDWSYGEQLIHEDYFTEYTEELVNDCWEMPKEMRECKWPWSHMNMHWEAAAEELKQDYFTIEVDGETYYIRS